MQEKRQLQCSYFPTCSSVTQEEEEPPEASGTVPKVQGPGVFFYQLEVDLGPCVNRTGSVADTSTCRQRLSDARKSVREA